MNMGHLIFLLGIALFATGCGPSATSRAIVALNTAADVAESANKVLIAEYENEQNAAIEMAASREDAEREIREIRERYKPAWIAQKTFRLVWIDAATAVQIVQLSGEAPDVGKILRLLERLAEAQRSFIESVKKLE